MQELRKENAELKLKIKAMTTENELLLEKTQTEITNEKERFSREKEKMMQENIALMRQLNELNRKVSEFNGIANSLKNLICQTKAFVLTSTQENRAVFQHEISVLHSSMQQSLKNDTDVDRRIARHLLSKEKSKKNVIKTILNKFAKPATGGGENDATTSTIRNRVAYWKHGNTLGYKIFGEEANIRYFYLFAGSMKNILFTIVTYQVGYVLLILLLFQLVPPVVGILSAIYTSLLALMIYAAVSDLKLAKMLAMTSRAWVNFGLVLVGSVSLSACFHYDARSVIILVAATLSVSVSTVDSLPVFYLPAIRIPIFIGLSLNYLALLLCVNLFVFPDMDNVQFNFGTINGISKVPVQISLIQLSSTAFSILFLLSLDYLWFAIKNYSNVRKGIPVLYGITMNCYGSDDFEFVDKLKDWPSFKAGLLKCCNREIFLMATQHKKMDFIDRIILQNGTAAVQQQQQQQGENSSSFAVLQIV